MDPFALGSHDLISAHYLAHAAAAAYEDLPESYPTFERLELPRIQLFAANGFRTRGYVAANDEAVVVAFRGTDEIGDWITSIDYTQVNGYGGRVHRGFAEALDSVWDQVVNMIRLLREAGQPRRSSPSANRAWATSPLPRPMRGATCASSTTAT